MHDVVALRARGWGGATENGGGEAPSAEGLRWQCVRVRPHAGAASAALEAVVVSGPVGAIEKWALAALELRECSGGAGGAHGAVAAVTVGMATFTAVGACFTALTELLIELTVGQRKG